MSYDQSSSGLPEWKTCAPYRIHERDEDFEPIYTANCHCGRVKYQLSRREPLGSKLCHCMTCQTQHGAPFQWAAIFHKTDINFTRGHDGLEWYDPSTNTLEHNLPCKVRCSHCHSPIMDEGRKMILIFPSLVQFETEDDKAKFRPRCHIFYGQRVMDIRDGLPKWSGMGGESELIEDSPAEEVHQPKVTGERSQR
ncbi:Mss4-like protein [Favolaschia claudopus]|uniref:Mss4-like protein n=1 Tax=Favolaschia claudopus TaxID=2862362 RepID=A0AAW0D1T0_9AGAR